MEKTIGTILISRKGKKTRVIHSNGEFSQRKKDIESAIEDSISNSEILSGWKPFITEWVKTGIEREVAQVILISPKEDKQVYCSLDLMDKDDALIIAEKVVKSLESVKVRDKL